MKTMTSAAAWVVLAACSAPGCAVKLSDSPTAKEVLGAGGAGAGGVSGRSSGGAGGSAGRAGRGGVGGAGAGGAGAGGRGGDSADAGTHDEMDRDAGSDSAGAGGSGGRGGAAGGGVPEGKWTNATANLAGLSSECGNLTYLSAKPKEDSLIAGVATRGLYDSTDGAKTWSVLNTGSGAEPITNRVGHIVYDPDAPNTYYVAGIYHDPGIFKTTDNGATFHALGTITHNDSVSVDFTDPQRKTLLAGGHESVQTVHRSTDGGQTWTNVGANLPADTNHSSYVLVIDAQTHLVGCAGWASGKSGIFRTTNGGQSWTQVSELGGGAHPLVHSDGSIYWAAREGSSMVRSTDKGATWQMVAGSGVVFGIQPIELPNGRVATLSEQGVIVTSDHGKTWSPVAPKPFSFGISPLVYSPFQKAFYSSYWTCSPPDNVPTDAIAKFAYDAGGKAP